VGISADHAATLEAFTKQQGTKHLLLSDFRRSMLPAWGALETNEQSPIFRYAKRAYFVVDRQGVVRYQKIMTNALDLLNPEDVLKALKESGVS
jgi:glutaredoxin-dependent peroxiredoxin